ncbi:MAG: hypothetical protein V2J20_07770 [Wenzhouxiangella sp.]|jgi:hypothetical protein|nr:hypothetical protein [Wenzhouxiangella sp.]
MRDKDLPDISERLSDETLKKAEELCQGLSSSLSIDKRGEAVFHDGAVKLLDTPLEKEYLVTVCEVTDQPWFTLIGDKQLPASGKALLVFKSQLAPDSRYLGKLKEGRAGLRSSDEGDRFFSIYEPVQDARYR